MMSIPVRLALGSNLGDREELLQQARDLIEERLLTGLVCSPIHETDPVGPPQPKYLNQIVRGECEVSAMDALQICLGIEKQMGRERTLQWGPRSIDIDILTFGDQQISETMLTIPHPRLMERSFVLAPWADLEPNFVVPVTGRSVADLLAALPSSLRGTAGC
jgi:2-amino-4-hydroxy-6-hydroxymethyldihydropteridine diphosphokinase